MWHRCRWAGGAALAATLLAAPISVLTTACGGGSRRTIHLVRVAPPADPDCGAPADARTLLVTALGEFPATESTVRQVDVGAGAAVDIDSFPAGTRELAVEVRGFGGAARAVGRTRPFDLAALDDGAEVPVFMAPERGFCPTGPPAAARIAPLVARAGDGVLVAGGTAEDGTPVHEVELYDPPTGQFSSLGQPLYGADLDTGLVGATMTAMPGGRVVVVGGAATAYQVYDPAEAGFGQPRFLREARAFHAAVALDDDHLLLAGGCARLDGAVCAGDALLSTSSILTVSTGELEGGPSLLRDRVGGIGLREGDGRVLLVGGTDGDGQPVDEAERIDPAGAAASELVAGTGAAAAGLAAGGVLTGFAPAGAAPAAGGAVVPPGAGQATAIVTGAPRAGASVTALESGAVLIMGGLDPADDDGSAGIYAPVRGVVDELAVSGGMGARRRQGAVRLDDGSVLIVGGQDDDGAALDDALIFRPELLGPLTGGLSVTFSDSDSSAPVVPRDPARARVIPASGDAPAHYLIESADPGSAGASAAGGDDVPREWAVLAGPRFSSLTFEAAFATAGDSGGAAALLWFAGESEFTELVLRPGQAAALAEVTGGQPRVLSSCSGEQVTAADLTPPASGPVHQLTIDARSGEVHATLDGREILRCPVDPPEGGGLVGVAPLGGAAASLRVDLVSVTR